MAQGCWSVVPVCATSYSGRTGPHWGSMESPRTAARSSYAYRSYTTGLNMAKTMGLTLWAAA